MMKKPLTLPKKIIALAPLPARRLFIWPITILSMVVCGALVFLIQVKTTVDNYSMINSDSTETKIINPFPVSVNPTEKTITENTLDGILGTEIASNHTNFKTKGGWFALLQSKLNNLDWYQNLATPISRTLIIYSGERSEEIADNFAGILGWTTGEREEFLTKMASEVPELQNGKMYPGKYTVTKDSSPENVAVAVADKFNAEIRTRYTNEVESIVPMKNALIIASLLEREAYDFEDMRYISGVIWNRLFIGMRLQIDATLQYVKGSGDTGPWWPVPVPDDKYLKSPYNTYLHKGLPPEPIANPSIDAIIAALNPRETDCLFYFHDQKGKFYCTETYEEHVALLKQIYGQGK